MLYLAWQKCQARNQARRAEHPEHHAELLSTSIYGQKTISPRLSVVSTPQPAGRVAETPGTDHVRREKRNHKQVDAAMTYTRGRGSPIPRDPVPAG